MTNVLFFLQFRFAVVCVAVYKLSSHSHGLSWAFPQDICWSCCCWEWPSLWSCWWGQQDLLWGSFCFVFVKSQTNVSCSVLPRWSKCVSYYNTVCCSVWLHNKCMPFKWLCVPQSFLLQLSHWKPSGSNNGKFHKLNYIECDFIFPSVF